MAKYHDFAELLNQYLMDRDRNISWLARQLQVNHGTVSRWLSQATRPSTPELVIRIADTLGVFNAAERQALLHAAGYGYLEKGNEKEKEAEKDASDAPAVQPAFPEESSTNRPPPFMVPELPPQGVLGREELLRDLHKVLRLDEPDATNVAPAVLHGMGGIGKTTLAIALGRQDGMMARFPDGILWATLGPTPTVRNLLDDWGHALGENLIGERDAEACQKRLSAALQDRRMLLVVDDVWDAAHGQTFLVAGPHCRQLFTTRESPTAYILTTRERTLSVDVLPPTAALTLLDRLCPQVVSSDMATAARLCERLEFLPLALTLAGRFLAQEADIPSRMARMVDELIERGGARLQLQEAIIRPGWGMPQPASLQAILGMSVARLTEVEQERFAILSAFGSEPLTWDIDAAAHLWACNVEAAEATTAHFIQRGLVMQRDDKFWMHALLADYAAQMLEELG